MTDFTPTLIKELKSFLVERYVDNMETKDLVQYVTDDMISIWSHFLIMKSLMNVSTIGMIVLMMLLKKSRSLKIVISKRP